MPRSFSKDDQDKIRRRLIEIGKELFYSVGYKDTSIKDITQRAGIASGSFYVFFESKEELFMKIYFEENKQVSKEVISSIDMSKTPKEIIKEVFSKIDSYVRPKTIMGSLKSMSEYLHIVSKLKPEQKEIAQRESFKHFLPLVTKWQEEGIIKKMEPEMILALFDSIFYIKMHKEDIGEKYFPSIIKYLFEFTLDGILESGGDEE